MMRMHRREFLRLGAGVFAAAFFTNIPEFLLDYRLHDQSETVRTSNRQEGIAVKLDDRTLSQLK